MKKAAKKEVTKSDQKVTKKPTVKKKKVDSKLTVQMVSYSIKMVIPTGQYANIQPEIIVKGGTLEEAHAYVAPHMNKLWKEYFMVSERIVTGKPAEQAPKAPVLPPDVNNKQNCADIVPPAPVSSVALNKATQAVASCMSKEALDLIAAQVEKSVKLTDEDKVALRAVITNKSIELSTK